MAQLSLILQIFLSLQKGFFQLMQLSKQAVSKFVIAKPSGCKQPRYLGFAIALNSINFSSIDTAMQQF